MVCFVGKDNTAVHITKIRKLDIPNVKYVTRNEYKMQVGIQFEIILWTVLYLKSSPELFNNTKSI